MPGTSNSGSTISRPGLRAECLRGGDAAVELDHRRRADPGQAVVQRGDPFPVGVLGGRGSGVAGRDRRLQGVRTDGAAQPLDPLDVRQAALDQQAVPAACGPGRAAAPARRRVRCGPATGRPGARSARAGRASRCRTASGAASIRPSRSASAHRSLRIHWSPLVAEWPSLKTR